MSKALLIDSEKPTGFTMSLFVSELAFGAGELLTAAKVGILVASLTAGLCGYLVLRVALPVTTARSRSAPDA